MSWWVLLYVDFGGERATQPSTASAKRVMLRARAVERPGYEEYCLHSTCSKHACSV